MVALKIAFVNNFHGVGIENLELSVNMAVFLCSKRLEEENEVILDSIKTEGFYFLTTYFVAEDGFDLVGAEGDVYLYHLLNFFLRRQEVKALTAVVENLVLVCK